MKDVHFSLENIDPRMLKPGHIVEVELGFIGIKSSSAVIFRPILRAITLVDDSHTRVSGLTYRLV